MVSQTVDDMVEEAKHIHALPYYMVVKIPATEAGLAAIKKIKLKIFRCLLRHLQRTTGFFAALLAPIILLLMSSNRCDGR